MYPSLFHHASAYVRLVALSRSAIRILIFIFCMLLLSVSWLAVREERLIVGDLTIFGAPPTIHVLIPASHPDVNLCKALISTKILGYPQPVIINWNITFDDNAFVAGGSHLAKIEGVAKYLNALNDSSGNDLVLLLDGYDVWTQLRPEALVRRFKRINKQANTRVAREVGHETAKLEDIKQDIIFGCQKRCWPWTPHDPPCYAVPTSSLPIDVFGADTDTESDYEPNPYLNYRPRYLNSGVVIGNLSAMRRMFNQAVVQLSNDSNFGSDQYVFSHIFGDQELYREILRRDHNLPANNAMNPTHLDEIRAKAAARQDKRFEFGIGLDYGSEIALNTVFAENDTAWLTFDNINQLRDVQEEHGIEQSRQWRGEVSPDITGSPRPLTAIDRRTRWSQVQLLTNVYTGISPVVIHNNAHREGMKALRESWWPRLWFFDSMLGLLKGVSDHATGNKTDDDALLWEDVIAYDGLQQHNMTFGELCKAYRSELFRGDE